MNNTENALTGIIGSEMEGEFDKIDLTQLKATELFSRPDLYKALEEVLKKMDVVLIIGSDDSIQFKLRGDFLPDHGYLMHFNIATSKPVPHIEPLPKAHDTISTAALRMIEGQKQYVLEAEAAIVCVLEGGVMRPLYLGTFIDFGDRTPRLDDTGRTHKTWTKDIADGGSSGMSTTWAQVDNWEQIQDIELEYWVYDQHGQVSLHTPNASANSLKLWGARLGEWVAKYPQEKLDKLGIVEGKPFLLSTGQILLEDDGGRSIDPATMPQFTAKSIMRLNEQRSVQTIIAGKTVARTPETFCPADAPLDGDYFTYFTGRSSPAGK